MECTRVGFSSIFNHYPMKLGDLVTIGKRCIIEAAQIGSGTEIQDDCIIVSHQTHRPIVFEKPTE